MYTNVYSNFIHTRQNLEVTKSPSVCELIINCGTSKQWDIIQHYKEMSYQSMKTHGGNVNVYYYMNKTNLKSLCPI